MVKAIAFVMTVIVSLIVLTMTAIAWATDSWWLLVSAALGLAIAALLAGVTVLLTLWAFKRWGDQ